MGTATVMLLCAVMVVRQMVENQSRHAEEREAFILLYNKGHLREAEQLLFELKYDIPGEPTRHLIDDLQRMSPIAPTNQSGVTNLLVRYHRSVKHELEKRLEQRYLKARNAAEAGT